jgi:hypothetical protein
LQPARSRSLAAPAVRVVGAGVGTAVAAAALALSGCPFFFPPEPEPPDPSTDGILACGESMDLGDSFGGDAVPLDVGGSGARSLLLVLDWDEPERMGARLRIEDGSGVERFLELWDGPTHRRVIPAFFPSGAEADLELIVDGGGATAGTATLSCSEGPAEQCGNLADDDGDGALDCADLHCARDAGCAEEQEDLETIELSCAADGSDWTEIEPPVLGTLDDQRTLYSSYPGGEGEPAQEFRGGAEIVLAEWEASGTVHVEADEAGMLCAGLDAELTVFCEETATLGPDSAASVAVSEGDGRRVWLEPDAMAWVGIRARLDCE